MYPNKEKNLKHFETKKVHFCNHKLYKSKWIKISKIHIKFKQEKWMASYIQLNTNLRTNAKSDFEKDFFKLMKRFW